jgi:hypothetical protein
VVKKVEKELIITVHQIVVTIAVMVETVVDQEQVDQERDNSNCTRNN